LTTKSTSGWEDRVGRRLTLWDLNVLQACVDLGSISKAAEEVRLSKPAISKIITGLERELGTPLVNRSWRGLEPTDAGRALLSRSQAALHELESAVSTIHAMSESKAGELRIAANEVALSGLVGEVISRLHTQYPEIHFEIVSAYTRAAQIHELEQGNVELVIGQIADTDHHIETSELFRDRLVVVAGRDSVWQSHETIELAELLDEPWAFSPLNTVSGRTMEQAFRLNGLSLPKIMVVGSSMQLLRRLVTGNEFLALFPASVASVSKDIMTLPVAVNAFWQPIGMLTIRHRTLSPPANLFIECARTVVRESGTFGGKEIEADI